MTNKTDIKVTSQWDKDVVPANEPRKRGLLVEIKGIAEKRKDRRPVNLCLVIDRSGSMANGKIEAAKEAAKGVVDQLGEEDVLSIVEFDDQISTLVSGIRLDNKGKRKAIRGIETLSARGMTNLGGGWLEGATQAANAMDEFGFKNGHVVVLSDGHANQGIVNPSELRAHADEMASRGVTTSTVGVGNGYSPLQLEALSEGGLGRLHDAATPEEIIETILGELGDVVSVVATDVELLVRWQRELRVDLLANFDVEQYGNAMNIRLGHLIGGSQRTVPLVIDVPALPAGEVVNVELIISGKHAETGKRIDEMFSKATLRVVPPAESAAVTRDWQIAERISLIWESTLGLDAMRLNEQGDYIVAGNLVQDVGAELKAYAVGTPSEHAIRRNLHQAKNRVSRRWDGRSKRESMIAAKKFSKGESDHRSDKRGGWSDYA